MALATGLTVATSGHTASTTAIVGRNPTLARGRRAATTCRGGAAAIASLAACAAHLAAASASRAIVTSPTDEGRASHGGAGLPAAFAEISGSTA